jgi:hypothetical protein
MKRSADAPVRFKQRTKCPRSRLQTIANNRQPSILQSRASAKDESSTTANSRASALAMPYDPTIPATNAELTSALFRGQFNGLKDLIDAIQTITAAQVDAVNTVNPGDPAVVTLSVAGGTLHFSFDLPRGQDGASGAPITSFLIDGVSTLNPGEPATVDTTFDGASVRFTFGIPRGENGGDGMPGPPFAQCVVDGVTTLDPNEPASVDSTFDGSTVHFTFSIPRGADGNQGAQGEPGGPGGPGEVSLQQLTDAIATTSSNSNAVNTLGMAVSDPPTQSEVQQIADKIDELILALRR